MNVAAKDFKTMRYPVYDLQKPVVFAFPLFERWEELSGREAKIKTGDKTVETPAEKEGGRPTIEHVPVYTTIPRDLLLRYVMFAYSRGSAYVGMPISPAERRAYSLALAEKQYNACNRGDYEVDAEARQLIIDGTVPEVNDMITCYFKVLNDRDYELYVSALESFSQLLVKVREPLDENKLTDDKVTAGYLLKKKCLDDAFSIQEKLKNIEADLFPGIVPSEVQAERGGSMERRARSKAPINVPT